MSAKRSKAANKAKAGNGDDARDELLRDGGGFDWGWPRFELALANDELGRRLIAGGFSGCGYGVVPNGPPFISLLGDRLPGMKSALALIKDWTKMSGPNAVRVEIAFDGPGYVLAISQQRDLLRWRLSGIDTAHQSIVVVTGFIKRMDSRHPILDQLANYAQQPIAPVWLIVGEMPRNIARGGSSRNFATTPQWDNAILLPGIDIYRQPSDRPAYTMATTNAEFEAKIKTEPDPNWPPKPDQDPACIATTRERRLAASAPKTLHVLRNTDRGLPLLTYGQTLGAAKWQVEQAICNLRSADLLPYQPNSVAKRLAMIQTVRNEMLEPASVDVDLVGITAEQLAKQIGLDAAYLLRRLEADHEMADTVSNRIRRIQELGYG